MDWVIVAATVVIAITGVLTFNLTRRLAERTHPKVVAYIDVVREDVIIAFTNVGEGPARDLEVSSEGDRVEFENAHAYTPGGKVTSLLPPGQTREWRLGSFEMLTKPEPMSPFIVTVKWRDLDQEPFVQEYELDVAQYAHLPAMIDRPPPLAETLSSIQQDVSRLVSQADLSTTREEEPS